MNIKQLFGRHVAWTSDFPLGFEIESASGSYLNVKGGRRIIDMVSGIAVSSLGHQHPKVIQALHDQIDKHLHVMVYGEMIQAPQAKLAGRLAENLPEQLQVVYFTNSGTEANEGALKLAKKFTGRTKMIAFERSYHGDTHGSLSVTGRAVYQDPFKPLLPNVEFLPFNDLDALTAIDTETACVITEPIQGEGGIRVPSKKWLQALRKRCTDVGALLIFDEIQTGMGRTGNLFAFQGFDVVPDIMSVAKAFGGGMPLGAFVSSAEIFQAFRDDPPLCHVTTFGGHPVCCAAGDAALKVTLDENLPARATIIEKHIREKLRHPLIKEIRGKGAMLGLEMVNREVTADMVEKCLDRDILLGWTLHSDTLVRIAPALNMPFDVMDEALEIIISSLDAILDTPAD